METEVRLTLRWRTVGRVTTTNGRLTFPDPGPGPGVYRFRFDVPSEGRSEYVGEAASVRQRFATYASAIGKPGTNTKMRTRMTRALTEVPGEVVVDIAEPILSVDGTIVDVDLTHKLQRVHVEHAALAEALARGRPLLNGPGYPPAAPSSVLSGSPATAVDAGAPAERGTR